MILQKTIYNDVHRSTWILHSILYQITDDVGNVYRICRHQSLRTEMCLNRNIFILRNMIKSDKLFQTRFYIERTNRKLCMFIIGTRHITQLWEIGRQIIQFGHRIMDHFVHCFLIHSQRLVIQESNTHFQSLYRPFQFMYHGVYKAFSQFVDPALLQDGFYLKQQAKP